MKKYYWNFITLILLLSVFNVNGESRSIRTKKTDDKLLYHKIVINKKDSTILPWYSSNLGESYNFIINQVWKFWNTMRTDKNGLPYYMNHQVWREDFNDRRGVGGDQFAMALSSWNLYYAYSGNEEVKEDMKFIADYYLNHSLSRPDDVWPNIPYPYNTMIYSGIYDGDMVLGPNYTQPDKAGSFGLELVKLYKITNTTSYPNITDKQYLGAAIKIANTLAKHLKEGDNTVSPLPFKVNAVNGEVGVLKHNSGSGADNQLSNYTSNWAPTMELFLGLIELNVGDVALYQQSFNTLLNWMTEYPLKTNKWGPFFEDIPGWSDTQINAITFAQFMMDHREYFPSWKKEVKGIFNWVYKTVGNHEYDKYGVIVINEQTAYQTPGNSHSARQAAAELQYALLTSNATLIQNAICTLNWATYMVNHDGANCYPRDEVWMTDGYGDYVRHYLRSMGFLQDLAPSNENHLLRTTSIIQIMEHAPAINKFLVLEVPADIAKNTMVYYRTFDNKSTEVLRLTQKPVNILVNQIHIPESSDFEKEGWMWQPKQKGGVLTIRHNSGNKITILNK